MVEFFLVPMIGTGAKLDPFRARYSQDEFGGVFGFPTRTGAIRYSNTSVAILMLDAPQAYLDEVAAQPDADRWSTEGGLAAEIGGQRNTRLRNTLESLNIPGTWVSASDNWRETIRTTAGMFQFAQRHEGINQSGFFEDLEASGGGLNTQWRNLSSQFQSTIQATIDDHGWNISPDPNEQVRSLLRRFADQFLSAPLVIGGVQI